jgi:lipopolysaccharide assembly outer membrane protein LptD (OstA)
MHCTDSRSRTTAFAWKKPIWGGLFVLVCLLLAGEALLLSAPNTEKKAKSEKSEKAQEKPSEKVSEKTVPDDTDQVRFAVPGSVIKGFKAPRFDEKGTLIGLISGHTATVMDRTSAKVDGIRYEAYRNTKLDYELEANTCTYDQKEEIVRSTDQLRFKRTGITLTGDGFQWDIKNMRGTIKSNVVMVIENIENGVPR